MTNKMIVSLALMLVCWVCPTQAMNRPLASEDIQRLARSQCRFDLVDPEVLCHNEALLEKPRQFWRAARAKFCGTLETTETTVQVVYVAFTCQSIVVVLTGQLQDRSREA